MNATLNDRLRITERGAALITTLLIATLLLVAAVALLSGVARNTANGTDVLSETKAYYAAENGLQATINKLRYDCSASYAAAKSDPDMSTWLPYGGTAPDSSSVVVIGQTDSSYNANPFLGNAYKINVSDPDNIGGTTTFNSTGHFLPTVISGNTVSNIQGSLSADGKSVTYGTSPNRTTVSIVDKSSTTVDFSSYSNPQITSFAVQNEVGGSGTQISDQLRYEVDFRMTSPKQQSKTLSGTLKQAASKGAVTATFNVNEYTLAGSYIDLCTQSNNCSVTAIDPCVARPAATPFVVPVTYPDATTAVYAHLTPIPPTRLVVTSTGYGPQRSKKILEAIIERNFFDNLGSGAAISMIGPMGTGFGFNGGSSNGVTYSGVSGPSFGVTDPNVLNYLLTHPPGPGQGSLSQMQPPPALVSDLPTWQQSPASLDQVVQQYRLAAQGSGTYYSGGGDLPFPPGNTNGTGITFCEGNCKVTADGGGILVVTGQLTNVGDFDFTGLIIVTGAGGWLRNGGGNGVVRGNIVIAPYDPNNLAAGFLPPNYQITGGGSSDVIYTELSTAFDGTGAATDFVQGVAEK